MGPLLIELAQEVVEAGLLLKGIHPRRPGCVLLQGPMHTLMPAILLRVTRLDAFDSDAEPEPPHRELGEIEQGIRRGEGQAVVGADGERQASLPEEMLERLESGVFAR